MKWFVDYKCDSTNVELEDKYLIIDTYRNAVPNSPLSMRITYRPTGDSVEAAGHSRVSLKRQLLEELSRKVAK